MSNDKYIYEFLKDPNYKVLITGQINTKRDVAGHIRPEWRSKPLNSDSDGYLRINYKNKSLQVHRIIYAAFVGPLDPALVINHLDGNPANNTVSNLELVTQAQNNLHRFRTLGRPGVKGNTKLTQDQADEIRRLVAEENYRACDLTKKFKVSKATISMLLSGKTWK